MRLRPVRLLCAILTGICRLRAPPSCACLRSMRRRKEVSRTGPPAALNNAPGSGLGGFTACSTQFRQLARPQMPLGAKSGLGHGFLRQFGALFLSGKMSRAWTRRSTTPQVRRRGRGRSCQAPFGEPEGVDQTFQGLSSGWIQAIFMSAATPRGECLPKGQTDATFK